MAAKQGSEAGEALGSAVAIGVVGAGAMGAGIAQVAAAAGHSVYLFDTREGAAQAAREAIGTALQKLVAKGLMTGDAADALLARLHPANALEQMRSCGLVVEAIVEDLDAKRTLFQALEGVVTQDYLLATNTSSISITAIGSALRAPGRFAGMHFFNPAPLMPLVEVVSGGATLPAVAETIHASAMQWGKVPVYARSTPGFIVNRVARPFYAEALRVVQEGGSDAATLDALFREAGGFRMGPFELMDLIGHDVNYAVTRSVFQGFYGDPRFTPSLVQLELVEAGRLGRKSGRGFYDYAPGAALPSSKTLETQAAPTAVELFGTHELSEALAERLGRAGVRVTRTSPSRMSPNNDAAIASLDGCMLYVSDGRTATEIASKATSKDVVLVDLALDYMSATRLAITSAAQADDRVVLQVAGLLQAAGFAVSAIEDIPGMAVMRTVAMLANEAADAVHQQVCTAADCELAMRKGVNYPRGPLAWADSLGLTQVVAVLDNLAAAYGEERYRVSPLLRRKAQAGQLFFPAEVPEHG